MTAFTFPPSDRSGIRRCGSRDGRPNRFDQAGQRFREFPWYLAEAHAILRAPRPRHTRLHGREVQLERVGINRLRRVGRVEEPLFLHIGFDQLDLLARPSRELEIAQRLLVDREDPDRRAVLGGHVADRGAVGERQGGDARAEELDEFPDDSLGAQHLRDRQHQVRGSGAFGEPAFEPKADDLRDEHRHRLAQHRGFRLNASDTPPDDAQPVDHGRVGVGADQSIRVRLAAVGEHHAGEILEIDLMHDPRVWRYDLEARERFLRPPQQRVAFAVALELEIGIDLKRPRRPELIHDHRVVDDELGGQERVHPLGIAAHLHDGVPHRGEIHHRRHAREVLQQHARWHEGDFLIRQFEWLPARELLDVFRRDHSAVFAAQQVLEQDLQRVGEAGDRETSPFEGVEAEDLVTGACSLECRPAAEAVHCPTTFTATTKYSVSPKQLVGTPLCCW